MTNLITKQIASNLAFDTITKTAVELDAAVAAKAAELQLTEAQYNGFKQSVNQFRQIYGQAVSEDTREASQRQRAAGVPPAIPATPGSQPPAAGSPIPPTPLAPAVPIANVDDVPAAT